IERPARPIDFGLGRVDSEANLLNESGIATLVTEQGIRLWGNRTCSSDPKWTFLSVRRTADMIHESLLQAHLWAVDRAIGKAYVRDVEESVNAYLRHLKSVGAILGGRCWLDEELNSPANIAAGRVYFDFDFTPPIPAERVTFRSHLVADYAADIFAA
ncbi:MAG: phage tail sheath family protein, partial [Rhodocyclaceae bacterium]